MIVIALVYMTAIEDFRSTWSSIWKAMLVANIDRALVAGINYLIGSNNL